jgi:hypothetical protein
MDAATEAQRSRGSRSSRHLCYRNFTTQQGTNIILDLSQWRCPRSIAILFVLLYWRCQLSTRCWSWIAFEKERKKIEEVFNPCLDLKYHLNFFFATVCNKISLHSTTFKFFPLHSFLEALEKNKFIFNLSPTLPVCVLVWRICCALWMDQFYTFSCLLNASATEEEILTRQNSVLSLFSVQAGVERKALL